MITNSLKRGEVAQLVWQKSLWLFGQTYIIVKKSPDLYPRLAEVEASEEKTPQKPEQKPQILGPGKFQEKDNHFSPMKIRWVF